MDPGDLADNMNPKTDSDSAGITSETTVSEVKVSENVNENGVNIGNSCDSSNSKLVVPDNSASNYFEHNIRSEERSEHKIINDDNLFDDNLKNINPAPNVDDMVTDESKDPNFVVTASKDLHEKSVDTTADISETTDTDCGVSVASPDQCMVIGKKSEKRDHEINELMKKDPQCKNDPEYQNNLSSLKLLCDYGSDSDEDNESMNVDKTLNAEAENEVEVISSSVTQQPYRKPESEESETDDENEDEDSDSSEEEETSTSSSSEVSSSSSDESDDSATNECMIVEEKLKKKKPDVPKTKGELGLEDLPPIEDLHISVPESQCVEIGKVLSIVDSLVVVQSVKGCPTLDLDSILFLDHGNSTLGEVFDVFGKVGEACYCVRFNSKDHALERGVEVGMPVYFAPQTEHSKFVFLADLMKMKGSDASWAHNNEPPDRFLDYSDDEEERRAKKGNKSIHKEVIVEVDESQPQAKRSYHRGGGAGGGGRGRGGDWGSFEDGGSSGGYRPQRPDNDSAGVPWALRGAGPISPWGMPFNPRFSHRPLPPSPGPQPLLRPTMFANQLPRPGRIAPFQQPPSPWAVPPPAVRQQAERFATPPPFMQQQSIQGMNAPSGARGGFGGPPQAATFGGPPGNFRAPPGSFENPRMFQHQPPPTPPGTHPFAAQNMGSGPFRNNGPQSMNFGSFRSDIHGTLQSGSHSNPMMHRNPGQFGMHGPVFQNQNNNIDVKDEWMD